MITFREYRNQAKAFATSIHDMDDWLVLDISHTRDSDCLQKSNYHVALKKLGGATYFPNSIIDGEEQGDVADIEFNHWACGWVGHIFVRPNTPAHETALALEDKLKNYLVLDENDLSQREYDEADFVWKQCYNNAERIEYIRKNRYQFDFHDFKDMLGCVRGKYFLGCASELIR
jgi:hypothetical protein